MGTMSDKPRRTRLGTLGGWLLLFGAALGALTVFAALVPANIGVWPRFEAGGMGRFRERRRGLGMITSVTDTLSLDVSESTAAFC